MPQIIQGALDSATTDPSPAIEYWPAQGQPDGTALLIFPGGGYGGLAEHEGRGYAKRFRQAGIACFVVQYRLGSQGFRHPAMLEDALAALATIRKRADEFGIDPARVGVIGSSAGGHLAAHTLVGWSLYTSEVSLRPDFGVLCYPVICANQSFTHQGSFRNLAGPEADITLLQALSHETQVTADTPPCFLWHTGEDTAVPQENSLAFAQALRHYHVPFELHLYTQGRHGLGLQTSFDWASSCIRWIQQTLTTDH